MPKNDPAGYLPNVKKARAKAGIGYLPRKKQPKVPSLNGGALAPPVGGGGMKDRVLQGRIRGRVLGTSPETALQRQALSVKRDLAFKDNPSLQKRAKAVQRELQRQSRVRGR